MLRKAASISYILPAAAGLAFARVGMGAGSSGSFMSTDEGLVTDGGTALMLVVAMLCLLALVRRKRPVPERAARIGALVAIVAEAALLAVETALAVAGIVDERVSLVASALVIISASGAMLFWLRLAKGMPSVTAVTFVFGALAASEVPLWAFTFLPSYCGLGLAALLSLGQLPCLRAALQRADESREREEGSEPPAYFGTTRKSLQDAPFLIATAFGIGLLGIISGLLRGYPDGLPIPFTPPTRAAYALMTIALSGIMILLARRGSRFVMSIIVWVMAQLIACGALVTFALYPDDWQVGAVFAGALNSFMLGVVWYTVIAFETHGWRDPYFYALAGWFVWFGSRAAARLTLLLAYPFSMNDLLVIVIMGSLIVVSAQVLFAGFLRNVVLAGVLEKRAAPPADAPLGSWVDTAVVPLPDMGSPATPLARLMGLDSPEPAVSNRQAAMQHSMAQLGDQFLLSEREVEVLTLYAQGYTQKRVAETLFISEGTAHTHIKRIYTKTGLHSRQDILDYLEQYTS